VQETVSFNDSLGRLAELRKRRNKKISMLRS
jgi:hypothetical protein